MARLFRWCRVATGSAPLFFAAPRLPACCSATTAEIFTSSCVFLIMSFSRPAFVRASAWAARRFCVSSASALASALFSPLSFFSTSRTIASISSRSACCFASASSFTFAAVSPSRSSIACANTASFDAMASSSALTAVVLPSTVASMPLSRSLNLPRNLATSCRVASTRFFSPPTSSFEFFSHFSAACRHLASFSCRSLSSATSAVPASSFFAAFSATRVSFSRRPVISFASRCRLSIVSPTWSCTTASIFFCRLCSRRHSFSICFCRLYRASSSAAISRSNAVVGSDRRGDTSRDRAVSGASTVVWAVPIRRSSPRSRSRSRPWLEP
mmetsp:Transcript_18161/g.64366  ORF Transcript_18161/g.64366 Transcript_18161/m.64366 type:complete len:328 (+) Transcript_18161:5266-6249(+)